jgi:hypothetical protein
MIDFFKALFALLLRDDDDNLDLDWVPTSKGEAELQQQMNHAWCSRMKKKGRKV